jgi:hypothetical protein
MAHRIAEKQEPSQPLRVLPRGTALVQDYRAMFDTKTNRHVGWKFDFSGGLTFVDSKDGQTKRLGARVKQPNAVVTIAGDDPYRGEYIRHIQQGDLWAADPETAALVGVPFEPHFGGEHPEVSAKHGLDAPKLSAALRVHGFPEESVGAGVPWDLGFREAAEKKTSPAQQTTATPPASK